MNNRFDPNNKGGGQIRQIGQIKANCGEDPGRQGGKSPLGSGRATEACVEAGGEERTEQERRLRTWVSSSSSNDVASSLRIVSNHVANSVRIVSLLSVRMVKITPSNIQMDLSPE